MSVVGSKNTCVEQLAKQVEELQERLEEETSRRKELEEALRASEESRKAAEEKAAEMTCLKSSLLTNMSHELRTPLTSMLAHASILETKLDGNALDSARAIKRGGQRLTETLNSVLTLAQLEGKALEPVTEDVTLSEVLAESLEALRPLARSKGLWLRTSLDAEGLSVHSDPRCLRRILTNLIGNAIKFTEEGGVSVSIRAEDELVLEVSDTGVGMSEDFLDDLFEAFTQESSGLTRTHEGTGLGLAITKHLVRALGGEIEVETQKGAGTAFTVRLPCQEKLRQEKLRQEKSRQEGSCQPDKQPDTEASRTRPASAFEGSTYSAAPEAPAECGVPHSPDQMSVLLVEDNTDIRRVLEGLLDTLGDIVVCPDAETALDHAQDRTFDVILMDISLPRMSGVQALERLRTIDRYRDTPIIAMTGHALPGDRERLLDLGFTDYIGKPFSPSDLRAILQQRVHH